MIMKGRNIDYKNKTYPRLVDLCNELNLDAKYMRYFYLNQDCNLEESIDKTKARMEMCFTVNGIEFKSIREIMNFYGINHKDINKLLDAGVPLEQCVNIIRENNKIHFEGEVYANLKDLAKKRGMCYSVIYNRLKLGWTLTKAVNEPVKSKKVRVIKYA